MSRYHLMFPLVAALAVAACSNSNGPAVNSPFDVSIQANASTLGTNAFSPATFTISLASRTSVTFRNADTGTPPSIYGMGGTSGTTHDLVADDGTTFNSGSMAPGQTYTATFTKAGTYPYHCSIHPSMKGTIVVNP